MKISEIFALALLLVLSYVEPCITLVCFALGLIVVLGSWLCVRFYFGQSDQNHQFIKKLFK